MSNQAGRCGRPAAPISDLLGESVLVVHQSDCGRGAESSLVASFFWAVSEPAAKGAEQAWLARDRGGYHAAVITAALDAGVPLRDVRKAVSHADPRTRPATTVPAAAWTGTAPISSPPTLLVPPGKKRQPRAAS
jgi:hypothetical protein